LNGSIYERELVGILSGNPKMIDRISKKMDYLGKEAFEDLKKFPFYVTRAAGSKGADLVAVRFDITFVIEIKSSINDTLAFSASSGKNQEQAERLAEKCNSAGLFLTYGFRLKNAEGDPWRIFKVPSEPKGRFRSIYSIIPEIEISKNKNFVMKWNSGLPLHDLLSYLKESH